MYKFALNKHDPSGTDIKDVIYIPATILASILLFNLLIAVVAEAYVQVSQNRIANDYIEVAAIINEYQSMAMWNWNHPLYRYLLVVQDAFKTRGENDLELVRSLRKAAATPKTVVLNPVGGGARADAWTKPVERIMKRLEEMNGRMNRMEETLTLISSRQVMGAADQSYEL